MILTTHAIVGAAIANLFPGNPEVGFLGSFASHYILDFIPHYDYECENFVDLENKKVNSVWYNKKSFFEALKIGLDVVFAVALPFVLFVRDRNTLILTLIGIVGALIPDFLQFLHALYDQKFTKFFQDVHDKAHLCENLKEKKIIGVSAQILVTVIVLIIFFYIKG